MYLVGVLTMCVPFLWREEPQIMVVIVNTLPFRQYFSHYFDLWSLSHESAVQDQLHRNELHVAEVYGRHIKTDTRQPTTTNVAQIIPSLLLARQQTALAGMLRTLRHEVLAKMSCRSKCCRHKY